MPNRFYITTTLPYVNADPHIGFALELVQADALARSMAANPLSPREDEIFFNTGTDEHGLKIWRKAKELGMDTQEYCDMYAAKFNDLKEALDLSYNHFIRTTDTGHKAAAQEFWKRCAANGDIYKKNYQVKYCVGCELEKTESELEDGKCPLHPNLELELIDEENYFFRWSKYQEPLLAYYDEHPDFIRPAGKFEEIKNFVKAGLQDFSISRLKAKMPWGVPVPGDDDHVMYVWFDALVNYISTTGWPDNEDSFASWWGTMDAPNAVQVAGKDNLRQQSAMWQAMLMSAQLPNTKNILIHGFVTSAGQKMSKSLGNVVNPYEMIERYGTDAVRYYLLKEIPSLGDGDFSEARMKEIYEADLANELGNLAMRLTTLGEKDELILHEDGTGENPVSSDTRLSAQAREAAGSFEFARALELIWREVKSINKEINEYEPWKKSPEERKTFLTSSLERLHEIGMALRPFTPNTASSIMDHTSGTIRKIVPLFPKQR
jgi:methionyl-tRNA synthetase